LHQHEKGEEEQKNKVDDIKLEEPDVAETYSEPVVKIIDCESTNNPETILPKLEQQVVQEKVLKMKLIVVKQICSASPNHCSGSDQNLTMGFLMIQQLLCQSLFLLQELLEFL